MATAKGMKGSFQRCEVFKPQLLGRECSTRALAKGDFSRPRFFFLLQFFFSTTKKSALLVESFQRESLLLFFCQKEDTLGKVTLELCVSIILRGGRSIRLRRRKQHALTPPPPPSLSSSQKQVIVVRQSPRSRVFTKPTASE